MRKSLPRIELPQFSGDYAEWPAFRDLFHSMVDKDSLLENVERFYYLKTSLKGEASLLLRNLPTTAESYTRAWEILTEHYPNKRLLVRSCFAAFTSQPKMKGEAASELRKVFHGMLHTMGSLESIGRPVTSCSDLFVHLIVELLDTRSRREWEIAVSGTTNPPSIDTLKEFLECRKEHFLAFCEKFRSKTLSEKRDFVVQHKLCMNCFGKHAVADCSSKRNCAACQERHHSSIHDVCAKAATTIAAAPISLHAGQTKGPSSGPWFFRGLHGTRHAQKPRALDGSTWRAFHSQTRMVKQMEPSPCFSPRTSTPPSSTKEFGREVWELQLHKKRRWGG
ncbi:uncharacterized protein LOC112463434 [Temnothorax curvispinosus]|uniref:Uncharacterized protein LOC112463434 n=1 Tax=Temnothorax curvispinosus TaxID=300111 RepID=A0A6J1QT21_9HYME|nr:uncharacterized protein LOC112463434 [Temnothorax curvispinosus]